MSGCGSVQARFSEYLDGRLNGREMQRIAFHVDECGHCAGEWASLRQAQASLADLGPVLEALGSTTWLYEIARRLMRSPAPAISPFIASMVIP